MAALSIKNDEWAARLKASGLDSLEALMAFSDGDCKSVHKRGATFRTTLSDGSVVFIKRDHFTFMKEILKDLLRLRAPAQKTVKERRAFELVRAAGFTAPEVIAYGATGRFGLPHQAAMVMLDMQGTPLDAYIKAGHAPEDCRLMVSRAEETLRRLQEKGFDWPDHKPEHFLVLHDGSIGLVDLERLVQRGSPLGKAKSEAQLARFRSLLPPAKLN